MRFQALKIISFDRRKKTQGCCFFGFIVQHTDAVCYVPCSKLIFSFHPDKLRLYSVYWSGKNYEIKLRDTMDYHDLHLPETINDIARSSEESELRYVRHDGKKAKRDRTSFKVKF